jgi:hypothetical protein
MKTASFDIETFPIVATSWGPKWEAGLIEILEDITLAGFAVKPLRKATRVYAQCDFKTYDELVQSLWQVFDEYDVLIAHNGKSFDIKQSNAFFMKQGLPVPSPYKIIDTKLESRKYMRLPSHSLNEIGRYLGCGQKVETGGYELWAKCKANDPAAWAKMKRYNKQDVVLLEAIYLKMLPWMTTHPEREIYVPGMGCVRCGIENTQKRGKKPRAAGWVQEYCCKNCGKRLYTDVVEFWSSTATSEMK